MINQQPQQCWAPPDYAPRKLLTTYPPLDNCQAGSSTHSETGPPESKHSVFESPSRMGPAMGMAPAAATAKSMRKANGGNTGDASAN